MDVPCGLLKEMAAAVFLSLRLSPELHLSNNAAL